MKETVTLDVLGMHCPDCPKKVERTLLKLDGVSTVQVDYKTEKGYVTLDRDVTSITTILNRISELGFEAKIHERQL